MIKKRAIIASVLIAIILTFSLYPFLRNISIPFDQSDFHRLYYKLAFLKKGLFEYKEFPLRNPYLSGGYPVMGRLSLFPLNPLNIFTLLFDEIIGIRLAIFALMLLGALGMFYSTREIFNYNYSGALFSTLVFSLSGWGILQIRGGNYSNLYCYLFPWLFTFFIKIKNNKKFIILASLVLGLIAIEGALIIVPLLAFLLLFALLNGKIYFIQGRFKIDFYYLRYIFPILILTMLLFAIEFIPFINSLKMRSANYIHFSGEHSYAAVSSLAKSSGHSLNLVSFLGSLLDKNYVKGHGGMYLGIIPVVFFLSAGIIFFKRFWRYLVILIIFVIILFGSNSPIDFFKPLWHIHPFMHGIWKLDKYFMFPVIFLISLIGGGAFLFPIRKKLLRAPFRAILIAIASIGILNMVIENRRILTLSYLKMPRIKQVDSFFQVRLKEYVVTGPFGVDIPDEVFTRFYWLSLYQGFGIANNILGAEDFQIMENIIAKYYIDNNKFDALKQAEANKPMENKKINPIYKGEVFFNKPGNVASFIYFSPNSLEVSVKASDVPDILIINQRYDSGWKTDSGVILNCEGLLGIPVKKEGNYLIKLRYFPKDFLVGAAVSLLAMLGCILYWKKHA